MKPTFRCSVGGHVSLFHLRDYDWLDRANRAAAELVLAVPNAGLAQQAASRAGNVCGADPARLGTRLFPASPLRRIINVPSIEHGNRCRNTAEQQCLCASRETIGSQIAHIVYTAGKIDIAAAKQALERSKNKDVKAFATDMVRIMKREQAALALVKVTP